MSIILIIALCLIPVILSGIFFDDGTKEALNKFCRLECIEHVYQPSCDKYCRS